MNNSQLAQKIIPGVGGTKNVSGYFFEGDRLCFILNDKSLVSKKAPEDIEAVSDVTENDEQSQILIWGQFTPVDQHITSLLSTNNEVEAEPLNTTKKSLMTTVFDKREFWIKRILDTHKLCFV